MKKFEKLVRDRILEIVVQNGQNPRIRILDEEEYQRELEKKLQEETEEYIMDKNEEELADILEVIDAIIESKHFSMEDILKIKESKRKSRGGFQKKIFLIK